MKNLFTHGIVLIIVLALLLPFSGCTKTEEHSRKDKWLEYLSTIPAREEIISVYVQDMEYMNECEMRYPQEKKYTILRTTNIAGSALFGFYYDRQDGSEKADEEYINTLGIAFEDVNRMIVSRSDYVYQALGGTFDKAAIEKAVTTGPMNDLLGKIEYGDTTYYRWGRDDQIDLLRRSSVRPLGKGHRLALVDDYLFWTTRDEDIEGMIDGYLGNGESLADIEEYRLLAEALNRLEVFCGYLCIKPAYVDYLKVRLKAWESEQSSKENWIKKCYQAIEDFPLLKPYQAYATGAGMNQNGYFLTVILLNPDNITAEENVALLKERLDKTEIIDPGINWMEMIDQAEIESEGRLVMARLYGVVSEFWAGRFRNLEERGIAGGGPFEPLLVHE